MDCYLVDLPWPSETFGGDLWIRFFFRFSFLAFWKNTSFLSLSTFHIFDQFLRSSWFNVIKSENFFLNNLNIFLYKYQFRWKKEEKWCNICGFISDDIFLSFVKPQQFCAVYCNAFLLLVKHFRPSTLSWIGKQSNFVVNCHWEMKVCILQILMKNKFK